MEIRAKYGTKDCMIIKVGAKVVGLNLDRTDNYAVAILEDGEIMSDKLHCFRIPDEELKMRFE